MPARLGKILTVIVLVTMVGWHWTLLQTVAWTGMLADHLRTESLAAAMSDTFDGHHPCPLCCAIAAAKKSEKKNESWASALKFEFVPAAAGISLPFPPPFPIVSSRNQVWESCFHKPPVPPPRQFFI